MTNRGLLEEADHSSRPSLKHQRMTKPLMEKRRRARINGCIGELKKMIIDSGEHNIQNPKSKYEKADILEITVDYLKKLRAEHLRQELDKNLSKESYSAGFKECIKQVEHFMKCIPISERLSSDNINNNTTTTNSTNILDHNLMSQKLLTHLDFRRHELTQIDNNNRNNVSLLGEPAMELENQDSNHLDSGFYERNSMSPNSFTVIHHTRDLTLSSSMSSHSSCMSSKTMFSPPSSPEPESHKSFLDAADYYRTATKGYIPDIEPIDMRKNSLGYFKDEINGQHYSLDSDRVWRPF